MFKTIVPAGKATYSDLVELVEKTSSITKKTITIQSQFVIETEDTKISMILDDLIDALDADQPAAKKNGKAKATKKANGNGAMTSHQVRIDATDEIISTQAFNKRIAAGEVAELTNVTNAKGEKLVVMEGKLVKGPQS